MQNKINEKEASPMIKPPKNEFANKADAFAHAKKHGGKVMKKTFTHPTTGDQNVSYVVKEEVEELDEKDELLARTGMSRINKTPRPGQTDLRNIPAGNRPDSRNKFTDADKESQRKRLKAAIKGSLGKHTTPNLPEHAEIQESYNDDDLYSVHKDTGDIKHLGNPYKDHSTNMKKRELEAAGHKVVSGREINYGRVKVKEEISESHFKVGDKVKCLASGMTGKVVKLDEPQEGKYYTVKRNDGKTMKYAPNELKLLKENLNDALNRLMNEHMETIHEKINLAKADMGDVIKDFQSSDAPQFKGKSKEKRRQMAIAAKLGADRGARNEAYDEGEYDREGDMAKSDLRSIISNAQRVHDMLEDDTNLPEWVQSKITLSEDYISTVANYLASEKE